MARGTTNTQAKPSTPAKAGAKTRGKRRRSSGSVPVTLTVMVIVVLALTALPLCVLVLVGTLPTAVALVVDRHRRRYLARTVGAMNLAGVMPGALRMWEAGITFASLRDGIENPYNWLVMYSAAAVGWVLYFCVPPVVAMVIEVKSDETRHRLEARAKALIEEWGDEVTGRKRDG